jgi:ParB/RepB/Spo0J family partition protein
MILHIPLDRITSNPWQTRQGDPDPDYIKALALDIAANGLLQTPVGRIAGNPVQIASESYMGSYVQQPDVVIQLAFGHNRLAAYRWLQDVQPTSNLEGDWSVMPVDLRQLTDQQMADFAWSENEKRRDHTPIERALAIQKRMADFGWTQAEIAEHLGISRPSVSNALRLLKLPENVAAALADGRISERIGLAIVGYFDLPDAIKDRAILAWNSPDKMVQQALAGQLTSDQVRDKINYWCSQYGVNLARAPFGLDEAFMIPDVIAPFCSDCDQRYEHRNLCLNRGCYDRKVISYQLAILQRAANETLIPPLDLEEGQLNFRAFTSFRWHTDQEVTILAGKCPNLRLAYNPDRSNLPGHPGVEVVCSKREQFCSCLAGLKAVTPQKSWEYDREMGKSIQLIDQPLVALEIDQPTAEDLHAAAKQARQEKRQLERRKDELLQQAVERIAVSLTQGDLRAWKYLAEEINYTLGAKVQPMDNAFDVRVAILLHLMSGMTYPDHLAKCLYNFNQVLALCGLEPISIPDLPASEDLPAGKTLVEIFATQEEQL